MATTYEYEITGNNPLLLHADNIEWADKMDALKNETKIAKKKQTEAQKAADKARKAAEREAKKTGAQAQVPTDDNETKVVPMLSKPGDDRFPGFRWIGCLYLDNERRRVILPMENLRACLLRAAFRTTVAKKTIDKDGNEKDAGGVEKIAKGSVVTKIVFDDDPEILIHGKPIDYDLIKSLEDETDFGRHKEAEGRLGFQLWAKRATIGDAKHVRVRPRLTGWSLRGTFQAEDDLSADLLRELFNNAGSFVGLGDWRPGGKTPGPFGTFKAEIEAVD